ncbi:MAG: hypothetical protein MUF13_02740 [Akkermansiaceae bacterium]|nr:hypothetical protein [Akkermansiaceae bacterium]
MNNAGMDMAMMATEGFSQDTSSTQRADHLPASPNAQYQQVATFTHATSGTRKMHIT